MTRYFALLLLCASVAASFHGNAGETKGDLHLLFQHREPVKEKCPQVVEALKSSLSKEDGLRKDIDVMRAASWTLILDCQTEPSNLPIKGLHASLGSPAGKSSAMVLGAVYEFGLRVDADVDAARHWYRRLAFMFPDNSEEQWDDIRRRVVSFNPSVQSKSNAEIEASWAAGHLKSHLLEGEIAVVRKLMNGPIVDILTASDHLYRGSEGFPKNTIAARRILEIAAQKGAPEAQYVLALGILDSRFPTLRPTRQVQLLEAQRMLIKATSAGFLPALEFYASLCENSGGGRVTPVAYALNELARKKGGQSAKDALRRLKKNWRPSMDHDLQRAREGISLGMIPRCF